MAVDPRVQASVRERNLERQLRETQATIPQLTLQVSAADTARDQAEATLRNTRETLTDVVNSVGDAVNNDGVVLPPTVYNKFRDLDPDQFPPL